jgi:glycolate oxidase FAD binding subunit
MACRARRARGTLTVSDADAGTRDIADRVRAAHESGTGLRIRGAGNWLDAGRPCPASGVLDVGTYSGVIEYEPGDLTLTARAGTTLGEIARVTRTEGQWLALQPAGAEDGTLGATIATASSGPLASAFGSPRDHVLGCEVVTGTGDVVRAGGRVVKNVAGFDLVRLNTGAWGTLGVLTQVSVRLRALPEVDRSLAVEVSAADAWRWLRASEFTPLAAELLSGTLASRLGAGSSGTLLVRVGGNEALVRAAAESLASLGPVRDASPSVWDALAVCEPDGGSVIRLSTAPSRAAALWDRAASIVERAHGVAHATVQRGIVRCILPVGGAEEEETARLRGIIGALQHLGTAVVERLPASLWASLVPSSAGDALSARVRGAFDPRHILNPGILGEPS